MQHISTRTHQDNNKKPTHVGNERPKYIGKVTCVQWKRDLRIVEKRPTHKGTQPSSSPPLPLPVSTTLPQRARAPRAPPAAFQHKCVTHTITTQKRPMYMAKDGRRGLCIRQKRPMHMAKAAYVYVNAHDDHTIHTHVTRTHTHAHAGKKSCHIDIRVPLPPSSSTRTTPTPRLLCARSTR